MGLNYSGSFAIQFQNQHVIYENTVKCTVKDYEFNKSYNKTLIVSGSEGNLKCFASSSDFQPYITTIGLYDDANNLLAVGKVSQPIYKPGNLDLNFVIKIDT